MDARSHEEGLEAIAPLGQDVTLADGTTVTVKPITVGQLPRFVQAIRPAFGALVALAPAASSPGDTGGQGADSDAPADPGALSLDLEEMLGLFADHGPALNQAIAITTGMKPAAVDDLQLDDALTLVLAVWSVNQDFFARRVLPLLKRLE